MIIKEEDYIKHSGIKGMKWDNKKTPPYDVTKTEALRKLVKDQLSSQSEKARLEKLAKEKEQLVIGLQKAIDAKKARDKASSNANRLALTSAIKSITSDSIKKGKSFLDSFFSKNPKISTTNAIRKKNNSSPM